MKKSLLVLVALLFGLVATRPAQANDAPRLKKAGDDAMVAGRFDDALRHYDAAIALSLDSALHYNRASALERLNRIAEAVTSYERFVAEANPELAAKTPQLPMHVATLKKRTAVLHLSARPDGARVTIGGKAVGTTPMKPLRVDPGRATVEVSHDAFVSETRVVPLTAGEDVSLSFVLTKRETAAPAPAALRSDPPAPAAEEPPRSSLFQKWWFWTGAAAVVAAGTVAVVVIASKPKESEGDIAPGRITAPLLRF